MRKGGRKIKRLKPTLGPKVGLVSQRNRVFKDKKKEESKTKCRRKEFYA